MRTWALLLGAAALLLPDIRAASAPTFNASPGKLYLAAAVDGTPPAPQVIVLNNIVASSTLKWRATLSGSAASNCAISPAQGVLASQNATLLTLSASVPAEAGSYTCTVTLSDNGSSPPATNSATVAVTYSIYGKDVTPPPPDTTPPLVPLNLTAVATGQDQVSVSWYNAGDPGTWVAGYVVYRDGVNIAITGLTSYQDSGLANGSYHTYAVAAFNSLRISSAQTPPMAVTTLAPAPADVPTAYQTLYQDLESSVATDLVLLNAQGTGATYPVNYSASLTSANQNAPPRTNFTDLTAVDQELNALQSLGINAVMVTVGFPTFDKDFYEFIGQTASEASQTVQNYLQFYELVAQDIHGRKDSSGKPMRMIVEANPLLTVTGAGNGFNPAGYYQSLSFGIYETRRSASTVSVAQYVQPDYLIVQSEPDTDADNDYRPELNTPGTDVAMIQLIVNNIEAANISGLHSTIKLGSGMGTWQASWPEYLGTPGTGTGILGITGLDGIDNHIYYLNGQSSSGVSTEFDVSEQMIASAHASGKLASIAEYWMNKTTSTGENSSDVRARNTMSFWAALDAQFAPLLFMLANQKSLEYLSAFNDALFWSYEPYSLLPCIPVYPEIGSENAVCDSDILSAADVAAQAALALGQFSSLGTAYKADIAAYQK